MKTTPLNPYQLKKEIACPNLTLKTRYGNVNLKSLIKDQRIIIYTNPFELIPKTDDDRNKLITALTKLKELNYHLIGFNIDSFEKHLYAINWLNSQLDDYLIFPIFYQPMNDLKKDLEQKLSMKIKIDNPIYFINQKGNTQFIVNGDIPKYKDMVNIVSLASKIVLTNQNFDKTSSSFDN